MSEFTAKVLRNGQITIPTEIRAVANIEDGDLVTLVVKEVVRHK